MLIGLNQARTPPVGLILCTDKGTAEAHYVLEGLANKVLAAEYQTALPDENFLAQELQRTWQVLEARQPKRVHSNGRVPTKVSSKKTRASRNKPR